MHIPTPPASYGKHCRQCQYFNPCRHQRSIGDCFFYSNPAYASDHACPDFIQYYGNQDDSK